jgi:hypothetical protein
VVEGFAGAMRRLRDEFNDPAADTTLAIMSHGAFALAAKHLGDDGLKKLLGDDNYVRAKREMGSAAKTETIHRNRTIDRQIRTRLTGPRRRHKR